MMEEFLKNANYTAFSSTEFLGAKEIIKSMPEFYDKVYFSNKYSNILFTENDKETFENVTLLADIEDVKRLRQIIKNNFLYVSEWDSLNYTEGKDYGFSFLAANILFILILFEKTEYGYKLYSYDPISGTCFTTKLASSLKKFKSKTKTKHGEYIRTCDFSIEYMNDDNTKHFIAPKKIVVEPLIESEKGFIRANGKLLFVILVLSCLAVLLAASVVNH